MQNYKSYSRKGLSKNGWISIIAGLLIVVLVVGLLGYFSKGFQDWDYTEWLTPASASGIEDGRGNELKSGVLYQLPSNLVFKKVAEKVTRAVEVEDELNLIVFAGKPSDLPFTVDVHTKILTFADGKYIETYRSSVNGDYSVSYRSAANAVIQYFLDTSSDETSTVNAWDIGSYNFAGAEVLTIHKAAIGKVIFVEEIEEQGVKVQADVVADDAEVLTVTWTAVWLNPESAWATGKSVTDYITITPTAAGSSTAVISCIKAFTEKIKITVASVETVTNKADCIAEYAA